MPQFINPFTGVVPDRPLTEGELVRAIRQNIAAELEAVHLYMAHAEATTNELAKAVLVDIANEERVHAGEFQRLLDILTNGEETRYYEQGKAEVDDIAEVSGGAPLTPAGEGDRTLTVGTLRD